MSDIAMHDVPKMSVDKLVCTLADGYEKIIAAGLPLKTFPAVMLWGAPGVGKSQGVRQIAAELEARTKKRFVVTDVRLLLFNPIDLRGIPTANADKTLAVWLKPQIFKMDESAKTVNILFLDEISAAPPSVQAAAYQIALDRVIGEHRLPDNCIVIAAGNRVTDKSVAYKMPRALANRLLHIDVESSFDSWRSWAVGHDINDKVIGFLAFRRNYLCISDPKDDLAFATPRSWEAVSNILNYVNSDISESYPLIAGLVGTGVASELRTWSRVYADLPDIEDIFNGKKPAAPSSVDGLYALVSAMTRYAREHKSDMKKIENSILYADDLPADYSVVLLKDYIAFGGDFYAKLFALPAFQKWLRSKGKFLNGNV